MSAGTRSWTLSATHADLTGGGVPAGRPVEVDAAPQRLTIDLERTAIVVVDMQNDFCHPEGWFAQKGLGIRAARRPIAILRRLLPAWSVRVVRPSAVATCCKAALPSK